MAKISRRLGRLGVDWVDPTGKRRWKSFDDETDARIFLGRKLLESGKPLSTDPSLTLVEYAPRWLAVAAVKIRPTSFARYRRLINRQILPGLGLHAVARITQPIIRDWIARLLSEPYKDKDWIQRGMIGPKKPLARASAMQCLDVLRQIMEQAKDDGIAQENPVQGLSKKLRLTVKAVGRNVRAFRADQLALFLRTAQWRAPDFALGYRTLALTGLRLGEYMGLRWDDLSRERRTVRVERQFREDGIVCPPKTAKALREVDVPEGLFAALEAERVRRQAVALEAGRGGTGPWIAWDWPEEPGYEESWRYRNAMRHAFKVVLQKAKLPLHFTPHSLRHTFASLHLAAGEPIVWVQQQLGHQNVSITVDLYGAWMRAERPDAAASLERLVSES